MKKYLPFFLLMILLIFLVLFFYQGNEPDISEEGKKSQPYEVSVNEQKVEKLDSILTRKFVSSETLDCNNLKSFAESYEDEMKSRSKIAHDLAIALGSSEYTESEKEYIYQLSGGSLEEYRELNSWHGKLHHSDLKTVSIKPQSMPEIVNKKFLTNLILKRYDNIIESIKNNEISNQSIFNGQSILSYIIGNDKNISASTVSELINSGLKPIAKDIVTATKLGSSIELAEILLLQSEVSPNMTWYEDHKEYSLAMLAVEKNNYEHFKLWYSLGSPLKAKDNDYTVLDLAKLPNNEHDKKGLYDIFEIAALENLMPYKIDTVNKLSKWLPQNLKDTYSDYIYEIKQFTKSKVKGISLSKTQTKNINGLNDFLLEKKSLIKNYEEAIEKCSYRYSATSNKRDNLLLQDRDKSIKSKFSNIKNEDLIQMVAMISMLKSKDWEGYNSAVESFLNQEFDKGFLDLSLHNLIKYNAPQKYIERAIENGASLHDKAIFTLIRNNNISLAKALIKNGLKLDVRDTNGLDAAAYVDDLPEGDEMKIFINAYSSN